jgi:tryptophan halogenase
MEPLESTSIHLIQRAVLRLIRMLPASGKVSQRDVAEFNDQQFTDMEQIRDFLILHYKVTNRRDSPFWRQCADMAIPDSLQHKIELFRETGRVFRKNEELVRRNQLGSGDDGAGHHAAQAYHPMAPRSLRQEGAGSHAFSEGCATAGSARRSRACPSTTPITSPATAAGK